MDDVRSDVSKLLCNSLAVTCPFVPTLLNLLCLLMTIRHTPKVGSAMEDKQGLPSGDSVLPSYGQFRSFCRLIAGT